MKRRDRKSTDKSRAPGTPGPRKADASQFFARPTFQLLEPRTAFDAAAAATAADASDSDSGSSADHDAPPPADAPAEAADTSARDSAALGDALQAVPDAPASLQNAVIFIDAAVEDKGTIIANIDSSAEIVILDGTTDGVTQIADYLSGRSGIESLHIISHGEAGKVTLGSVDLTSASIDGAHSSALATIGAALADSADIMLYGCDVAASAEGEAFVSALAQATGADIGASLDPTGDFASGGDWQLEYKSGSVESGTIAADDYGGLLAPIAITNVGSSNVTAMTMAQSIAGDGVTILNATYSGANGQSGTFTGGTGYTKDWLAFDSGVVLTTGSTTGIAGSNTVGQTTTDAQSTGTGADADLAAVGAGESFDAATLSFEFIPTTNQVTLQFVFGSEEYNEYVYSTFNDAMGIWINGVNVALNPAGTPISIDTINQAGTYAPGSGSEANDPNPGNGAYDSSAPNLYINNAPGAGTYTTGMDGFTVTLSIIANVNVGVSNTIKIGVADIGDAAYDSYLFVKAGSLVGVPTANTDNAITGRDVPVVIDVLSNDLVGPDGPITITHIADKPIVAGGAAVTFASGSSVSLSTDGKLTYTPAAGKTGADLLTYTVADKSGHTSVGYIDIKVVDNAAPLLDLDTSVATPTGTVADSIVSNSYSNSTGTVAWNSSWSETGDDGAANSGDIKTVNDGSRTVLQIGGGANAIQRSADLSAYDNATLQFEYRRVSFDTFTDYVDVMASSDGVTFTQVGRLSGPADDSGYATFSANISNYISANTTIRLVSSNGLGNSDFLRIDNVVVTGQTPITGYAGTFTENGAPVAIASSAGSGVAISDFDSANISKATITITNAMASDLLSISGGLPAGITATISQAGDVVTLTGSASKADYETAIEHIRFGNTSDNPSTVTRQIAVTVSDETGLVSNTAMASISVTAVNDAPVAAADTFTTAEDTHVTFDVRGNDSDVDSAALTVTAINGTAIAAGGSVAITGGNVTLNANGTLTFTPAANWNGTPSFTYTVSDGALTSTASVSGTVTAVNDAPVAAADTFTTAEDTPITFDVRSNDSDVDSASLTVTAINGTAIATGGSVAVTGGNVTLNANGTLTFTPNANWNGTPSFSYTVSDGALTSTANVSGTVTAVNDAPVAAADTFTTAEDTPITFDVRGNDSDVDSATLTVTAINGTAIATGGSVSVTGGSVTLNANGTLTFTPNANWNGTPSFTYTVSDGALTSSASVSGTVTAVNDAPVANNYSFTSLEDLVVNGDVRSTSSDVDGDTLTVTAINGTAISPGSTVAISGGSLFMNPDGTMRFTPTANISGTFSTNFTISDGNGGTATSTVTLTIIPVNDAPQGTDRTITVSEDTSHTFAASDFGFSDVNDSPANTLAAVIVSSLPSAGSLTLSGVAVTVGQSISAASIANLKWTPPANANGADFTNFTFQVRDNGGTSNGGQNTDATPNTLKFNVTAVNDAPIVANDTFSTNEDTPVTIDVLANDSDVDSANVAITAINGTAIATGGSVAITGGSVTLNANGTLTFTPDANWNGAPTFKYTVSDGAASASGEVSGVVNAVADAPVLDLDADDSGGTKGDGFEVTFVENDKPVAITDSDVTLLDIDAAGISTVTITLGSFVDGKSEQIEIGGATINVGVATTQVVTFGQDLTVSYDGKDTITVTDAKGDVMPADLVEKLLQTATYVHTSDSPTDGDRVLTISVTADKLESNLAACVIHVTSVNDAPVAAADTFTTAEDTPVTFDVRGNDSDVDSASLTVTAINGTAIATGGSVAIIGGNVTLNANGSLTFTPNANWNGTPSFTYTVSDGALTSTANVSGTVTAVNDAPVSAADSFTTAEDTPITFDVRSNDSDVDSASLTVTTINGTAIATGGSVAITGGSVTLNANGTLTFTPAANWNGTPSFTYT
ncbi:MAG: Ig-like domain-containing protein, partial [Hyphomicrobium sp.]